MPTTFTPELFVVLCLSLSVVVIAVIVGFFENRQEARRMLHIEVLLQGLQGAARDKLTSEYLAAPKEFIKRFE